VAIVSDEYFLCIDNKIPFATKNLYCLFLDIDGKERLTDLIEHSINILGKERNFLIIETENGYHGISLNLYSWEDMIFYMEMFKDLGLEDKDHLEFCKLWGASSLRISAKIENEFKLKYWNVSINHIIHQGYKNIYEIMTNSKFTKNIHEMNYPVTIRGYRWKKWLSKRLLSDNLQKSLKWNIHQQKEEN
jgi:hypothetical protein